MRELAKLFDQLDEAVARAAEAVGVENVDGVSDWLADARHRVGFLGESVIIGIAGGSGSGKSALLNALVGREVAGTSPVRPTTAEPLAVLPAHPEPEVVALLDRLGIGRRDHHDLADPIVFVDLPDVDSGTARHRAIVEQLTSRLDGLIWVLDPEKYNDSSLHVGLLDSMIRRQAHVIFVLNQTDRVGSEHAPAIRDDLWKRLVGYGYDDPEIVLAAAAPRRGESIGIDEVAGRVHELVARKGVVVAKLVAEVGEAREQLSAVTGVAPGSALGFAKLWAPVRDGLVEAVSDHLELDAFADEVGRVGAAHSVGTLRDAMAAWRQGGPPDMPVVEVPDEGWTQLALPVTHLVADLERRGAPPLDHFTGDWPESTIRKVVVDAVGALSAPEPPEVPDWVTPATYAKYGLGVLAVISVLVSLVAQSTLEAGRWPVWLLLGAASLGGAMVLDLLAQRAGRAVGEATAREVISAVQERVARGVEREVAGPIRSALRARAELAGTLTELGLTAAAVGARAQPARHPRPAEPPPVTDQVESAHRDD